MHKKLEKSKVSILSNIQQPKISIITIVYNGVELLEGTILSVLNQTYQNIEYIIIDGASNDGTIDVIQKYASQISHWISEPDKGLYDAMNKGLKVTTGDFVWFMNCGDHIFKSTTIEEMLIKYTPEVDVIFGKTMIVNKNREHLGLRSDITTQKLPNNLNWQSLSKGMVVGHQAFLARHSIAPFYIENNLCADIDWVIKCLKKSKKNLHTHLILATFLIGGVSKQKHQTSLKDRYIILNHHFGLLPNFFNHLIIILRAFSAKLIQKDNYLP